MSTLTMSLADRPLELLARDRYSTPQLASKSKGAELAQDIRRLPYGSTAWQHAVNELFDKLLGVRRNTVEIIWLLTHYIEPLGPLDSREHGILEFKITSPDSQLEPGAKLHLLYYLAREGYAAAAKVIAQVTRADRSTEDKDPLLLAGAYAMAGEIKAAEGLVQKALQERRATAEAVSLALEQWTQDWTKGEGTNRDPELLANLNRYARALLGAYGDPVTEGQLLI